MEKGLTEQEKKDAKELLVKCTGIAMAGFEEAFPKIKFDEIYEQEIARIAEILLDHYGCQVLRISEGQITDRMKPSPEQAEEIVIFCLNLIYRSVPITNIRAVTRLAKPLIRAFLIHYACDNP